MYCQRQTAIASIGSTFAHQMLDVIVGSPLRALTAAAVVVSLGIIVGALEDLVTERDFNRAGLMSWEICRLRVSWASRSLIGRGLDTILKYESFRVLLALRLVAAVAVAIGAVFGELLSTAILIVFGSSLALSVRCPYGLDGAHHMHLVVFGSLFLASLNTTDTRITAVVTMFIAAQVLLAYIVSGTTKAASARWRSGDAIPGVMATFIYGNSKLHAILQSHPGLALLSCWAVIIFECAFPAAVLLGSPYLEVFLVSGLVFHALTALVMGLNSFFFAFVATYPCVIYLSAAWTEWCELSL